MKRIIFAFCLSLSFVFALNLQDLSNLKKEQMQTNFTLTKHLQGFEKPLVSTGTFTLFNNELIYHTKTPIDSVMKINKEGVFFKENEVFTKSEGSYDKGLFLALIELDFKELEKSFSLNLSGEKTAWKLVLKPTNVWIDKIFTHIVIFGGTKVERLELLEKNKDLSIYEFKE